MSYSNERKNMLHKFFPMCVALVLQNVVTISVNLADNIMLGRYSEMALSGVASVNQIQFIFQQLVMALGDGFVILCSQYWGKKQTEPMKKVAAVAMRAALLIACILFCIVSLFPAGVVGLFTTDQAIITEGVKYLSVIRFSYPFFAITILLLATLRSVEIVKIAFDLSIVTFCINCSINYILIYGNFGAPRLGAIGAAIGTLIARIIECLILLYYMKYKETNLHLHFHDYLQFDKTLRKDYLKLTFPMLIVQGLWGLNTAMQTVILGHMTSAAIAANSIASTLFMMVKSMAVGASSATSVIIGKTIGTGDLDLVKRHSKTLQKVFVMIGLTSGILLFFLRIPVLTLYTLSDETKDMANTFLIILSVVCAFMSYQMPVNNGIIRGGGNAMFVVRMDIISIWGIVIPLSFIMAFWVKASPIIVVCCLNADQVFKCVPAFIEVNYANWIRTLTRD